MRTMHIEVTLDSPQALGTGDNKKEMPKNCSKTTTVNIPIPNANDMDDANAWEKCFSSFKKWDSDGFLESRPSISDVMEAGIKVIARAEGTARINDAIRKALGKSGGKGRKSTVTISD